MYRIKAKLIYISLLLTMATACRDHYRELEKYYKDNTRLHHILSDSLVSFCRSAGAHATLRKTIAEEVMLLVYFYNEDSSHPIYFDSSFNRRDEDAGRTANLRVPINVIRGFAQMKYRSVSADSLSTFFGGEYHVKIQLGAQGDSQYGVLISRDTSVLLPRCDKSLSRFACLTEGTIP